MASPPVHKYGCGKPHWSTQPKLANIVTPVTKLHIGPNTGEVAVVVDVIYPPDMAPSRGRPRVYASNAERQKAYRARAS